MMSAKALGDLVRLVCKAREERRAVVIVPTEDLAELVRVAQETRRGRGLLIRRKKD